MEYIISTITKNIFSHSFYLFCNFFNSIHNTYDKIINSNIKHIKLFKYELEKTDIKNKLLIIQSILKIIIHKYNDLKDDDDNNDYDIIDFYGLLNKCPETLKIFIESLLDLIKKIKNELFLINNKIEIYNNSYFQILNKINIDDNIKNIILYNNILDKKIVIFFELLKLFKINID